MNPLDVQALFFDQLGIGLGDEMTDYLVRRFQEGGAAAAPVSYIRHDGRDEILPEPVRRFVELADALGEGSAIPAEATDPVVH